MYTKKQILKYRVYIYTIWHSGSFILQKDVDTIKIAFWHSGKQAETLDYPYRQKADFLVNYAARKFAGYGLEQIERHLASRREFVDRRL